MTAGLILLAIVIMAICYEVGYCKGFEYRGEIECEKFVKGNDNEQKSD